MSTLKTIVLCIATVATVSLVWTTPSFAGDYYVYACSSYGNTAQLFTAWTDAEHMNTANECMQPAANGGYRSLEINNPSGAFVYQGKTAHWIANAPTDISIVGAYTPPYAVFVDCSLESDGFSAQYFWGGGAQSIDYLSGFGCNASQGYGYGTGINQSFSPSTYFGWGVTCSTKTTCSTSSSDGAVLGVQGVRLTAQETGSPSVAVYGANNLWYQTGHWVRGGGWPVGFTASDPSGVCSTNLSVNWQNTSIDGTTDTDPDNSSFTQCWPTDAVTGTLDTTSYPNGPLTIAYVAVNAAAVGSVPSQTVQLDNTPVTLSLSTPDDPDPNVWINHSVHVLAAASAGPSGLGGTGCTTNDGPGFSYPSGGITLNGTGAWKVSCTSQNNALDVNGQPATSPPARVTVHIDETPPAISFEPTNPSDPQAVVVDTTDAQSGVAGGQIAMRPAAGGSWDELSTQFDGSALRARFDDASLPPGRWTIQATACDNAGNCASMQEALDLPVRTGSVSSVGLMKSKDLRGGISGCSRARRHSLHHRRAGCHKTQLVLLTRERVAFGSPAGLGGRLTSAQGTPIAGARINVLAAPTNGLSTYREVTTATTGSGGDWTAVLPQGPSRSIEAVYAGSATIQPSRSWASLIVPASVKVLRVWPRHIRWGGKVHIEARLMGGYLPPEGALVRLRLGYGNARVTYGVQEHVAGDGIFEVTNSFGPGPSGLTLHYWLQECTLPEGDYPFAPACGPRDPVTVGG